MHAPYPAPLPATIRVVDLETTGSRPPGDGVVEIGWQDVVAGEGVWRIGGERGARYVHPGRAIPARTSAIHHIVDEDVADAPGWLEAAVPVLTAPGVVALAAHRVEFERGWCTDRLTSGLSWICTWKCALRLWPDQPSHSNQSLRYERRPDGLDRALGLPAHRAGPDAYVTAHHLRDMLAEASPDQLIAWTREPALLVRIPYGPMRGRLWRDMDGAFLDSVLARNTDRDVRFTARHWAARRQPGDAPVEAEQAKLAL